MSDGITDSLRYTLKVPGELEPKKLSPQETLFEHHRQLTAEALKLMTAKNHDYASDADPYRNFRTFGLLGILVRLSDKLARLRSFGEKGKLMVADESVHDTVLDIINYAVLYEGYLKTHGNN